MGNNTAVSNTAQAKMWSKGFNTLVSAKAAPTSVLHLSQ